MSTTPHPTLCVSPLPGRNNKVLVLGTGGTIASERTSEGFKPLNEKSARDAFFRHIRQHPQLSDTPPDQFASPFTTSKLGPNTRYPTLRTPPLDDKDTTVQYEILDLENHMDSSEMTPKGERVVRADWLGLAWACRH
jgi:lysophospholipase